MENINRTLDDGQPPLKRLRQELESKSDSITKQLPKWIIDSIPLMTPAGRLSQLVHFAILHDPEWEKRLDPRFSNRDYCNRKVDCDEILRKTIIDCTDMQVWEPLFDLLILQNQMRSPTRGFPVEDAPHVIHAFQSDYLGDTDSGFLRAIDVEWENPGLQYNNILTVVQSSGMGKSRMVDKVAQQRILVPICLREDDIPGEFSYPLPDVQVRDYLLSAPSTSRQECRAFLNGFLFSLYDHARGHLERFYERGIDSYPDMVMSFYKLFTNKEERNAFYGEVVSKSKQRPGVYGDYDFGLDPFIKSSKKLKNLPHGVHILMAIDDIHPLYEQRLRDLDPDHTLYSHLKFLLDLHTRDYCTIVLSTVADLSYPAKRVISPSMQGMIRDPYLPPPYTDFPFDVHVHQEPLAPDVYTLDSVGSLEFTAKFGRPLWYAMYKSKMDSPAEGGSWTAEKIQGLLKTVQKKLSGQVLPFKFSCKFNASSLAIISARIFLEFSPETSLARKYEQEQVRSHLRLIYSVHRNREVIMTGSSSEPLVAEAAAGIMNAVVDEGGREVACIDVWSILGEFVSMGLGLQGNIGELIGRVISIEAMDRAIEGLETHSELKYQTPIPVIAYYKALLTKDAWEKVRTSVPANPKSLTEASATKTFEQAFEHGYFHFSHYAKANDSSPLSKNYAWALWLRGTAVICESDEELVDRAMPIFFSSHGTLSAKSVSWNLDKDEPQPDNSLGTTLVQSAVTLDQFKNETELPYISTVHYYSLLQNQGITTTQPPACDPRDTFTDEAPRYQIDICGLEPYGGLEDRIKDKIRAMIDHSLYLIYRQHPRKYGLPLLHQMQPQCTGDDANTAWFGGFQGQN